MKPLKDVIAALRRELDEAFQGNVSGVVPPRPQRVVLALEVCVLDRQNPDGTVGLSFGVLDTLPTPAPGKVGVNTGRGHTLTFEFDCDWHQAPADRLDSGGVSAAPPLRNANLEGSEAESIKHDLQEVFGPPGFDSSARATVFLEALAELSEDQIHSVLTSLRGEAAAELDEVSRKARHLISNVIRSGPLRSVEDAGLFLAQIFVRHPVEPLRQLIATTWRSQYEWPAGRGG